MKKKTVKRSRKNSKEQTLRLSPSEILESITDAFYAVDSNWRFTYINHRAEEWWHRRREELLGTVLWDMFPEPEKTLSWEMHHKAASERIPVHWETPFPNLEACVNVNAYPTPDEGLAVYFCNITGCKQVEDTLLQAESTLSMITDNMLDLVAIKDIHANYQYVSPSYRNVLGYDPEALVGKNAFLLLHPDDSQEAEAAFQRVIDTTAQWQCTYRLKHADGHYVWLETIAKPLLGDQGEISGIIMSSRDVTQRKRAEEALIESEGRLSENARRDDDFLAGDSEMATMMRTFDFSDTPFGPVAGWPQSLRSAVNICLTTHFPIVLFWGPELAVLYNDAYIPMLADKHPWALGQTCEAVWDEIFDVIGPLLREVMKTGVPFSTEDFLFEMQRKGYKEETHFQFSYGAARDESGAVGGIFCVAVEITDRVFYERRLTTLSNLKSDAKNPMKAAEDVAQILDGYAIDMPFSLIYLLDKDGKTARLAGRSGLPAASQAAPVKVDLTAANEKGWPLSGVAASGTMALVERLQGLFGDISARHWPDPPHSAAVLPLMQPNQQAAAGLLVLGISPRRAFDDAYRCFFELTSEKIASMIANADAFEQERRRAEALAELDRAKTIFFSNVSHEFRTPLTLMLGPMEELLTKAGAGLPLDAREQVSLAHRNGLRLLKLVNTLLDFSRIEAGRMQASYEPTDLANYTAELASVFRSAIEKAGLHLNVDCAPLPEPVYIDREMWEKIVLNLLSNAFKFTFEGEIEVKLCLEGSCAVLKIRDPGVGIPAEEMPRLFERFHRVQNMRSRTHEGSGIGLALVQELVKIHGGSIHAESRLGIGTTFTITLPLGKEHLPPDRIGSSRTLASTAVGAFPFVEEALRWLPEEPISGDTAPLFLDRETFSVPCPVSAEEDADRPVILIADDNADMCLYLARLLAERYHVVTVPDGLAALSAAREQRPDLILGDVMMPNLDGFGLMREIRADDALKTIPVILLSARAGEESRVEGMEHGADDYLIKPFSTRELLARVAAHLDMARMRKEYAERIRQSEERLRALVTASFDVVYRMSPDWDEMRYLQGKDFIPDTDSPNSSWLDKYIHPDDQPHVLEVINEAIRNKNVFELEHRVLQVDGILGWTHSRAVPLLDASGEIVEWIGTASDITGRKNMEEILTFQAHMLASLQEAICAVDENFNITFWNKMAEKIFGWTAQEAIGSSSKEIFKMISPSNREESIANILKNNGYTGEAIYRNRDGKEVYTSVICSVMRDAQRNYKGNVSSFRDITERKQMEEALRESEAKYHALFENTQAAVYLLRLVLDEQGGITDLIYIDGNQADRDTLRSVGKSIDEIVNRRYSELWPPEFTTNTIGMMKRLKASSGTLSEEVHSTLTDTYHLTRLIELGPDLVLVTTVDLTELKRMEAALRESEKRQAFMLRLSDTIRSLSDPTAIQVTAERLLGEHLNADRAFYAEFILVNGKEHYELQHLYHKPGFSLPLGPVPISNYSKKSNLENTEVVCDLKADDLPDEYDRNMYTSLNIRSWVRVPVIRHGRQIAAFGVHCSQPRNWTKSEVALMEEATERIWLAVERAKSEETLKISEANFHAVFERSQIGIVAGDMEGRVVQSNPAIEDMLGYGKEELLGMAFSEFTHPEDLNIEMPLVMELKEGKRDFYEIEKRYIRKNGQVIWVKLIGSVMLGGNGERLGLAMIEDITERKKVEETLRESEERHAYLLKLSDILRPLSEVKSIWDAVTSLLAGHLGVSESSYNEIIEDSIVVQSEKLIDIKQNLSGTYKLGSYPASLAIMNAGGNLVIPDVLSFPKFSDEERTRALALNFRAIVSVPFIKDGKLVGTLAVRQTTPRNWTPEEVELIHETAERTGLAMERVKAEEALRESRVHLEAELADTKLLQSVSAEIINEEDAGALYEKIINAAVQIMHSEYASIQMLYPERGQGGELKLLAFYGFNPAAAKFWEWVGVSRNGTCSEALRTGQRVIVSDVEQCDYMRGTEDLATFRQTGIRSCQTTPLFSRRGKLVGTISTHWSYPHEPSERDLRVWDILVRQAADLIDRKRLEEETLASERGMLKVTLDSIKEGVLAFDLEARILFINETAARLIGYSPIEAFGQLVTKIFYVVDDRTSKPILITDTLTESKNPILVTRDLREIPISLNSSPIVTLDGRMIGTVAVFQDITEKQRTEQELFKAAKLESLGVLAGGVAHDFNNILAGILANLQLAMIKLKKHQDISNYMDSTIEITRKASNLTKQLLTFAKGGEPVKKSVSIVKLIKDTIQFALSGSKVKAEFHLPEDLWIVDIDEGQIAQVLNNLAINAEQAMPDGGTLEIYAENVLVGNENHYNPGQYVKLTVKDQGTGIPPEIIDKIFDPFFTTKKTGNGLGLSSSYSIIKKHDGYLEVESTPRIGSTFYIYLPASIAELALTDAQREIAASGEAKILLMDDEDTIRNVGGEMLACFGYRVTLARDGKEAIDLYKKAKETSEPFDVVIMDLTIPGGLGGIETMAILRQFDPEIKAIISSGYASDPVMSDYERYGFNGVVTKPYVFDELFAVLNKVIDPKQLPLDLSF